MTFANAGVLELADEVDSKSIGGDTVRVRPPPPAPRKTRQEILSGLSLIPKVRGSNPATYNSRNPDPRTSSIYIGTKFYFFTALRIFHKGIFCGQSRVEDPVDTSSNCNRNFTSFLVISEKVCF